MKCVVKNCGNKRYKKKPGISFHKFPKYIDRCEKWIEVLGLGDFVPNSTSAVCSNHFSDKDLYTLGNDRKLFRMSVPCLNLGTNEEIAEKLNGTAMEVKSEIDSSQESIIYEHNYSAAIPSSANKPFIINHSSAHKSIQSTPDLVTLLNVANKDTLIKQKLNGMAMQIKSEEDSCEEKTIYKTYSKPEQSAQVPPPSSVSSLKLTNEVLTEQLNVLPLGSKSEKDSCQESAVDDSNYSEPIQNVSQSSAYEPTQSTPALVPPLDLASEVLTEQLTVVIDSEEDSYQERIVNCNNYSEPIQNMIQLLAHEPTQATFSLVPSLNLANKISTKPVEIRSEEDSSRESTVNNRNYCMDLRDITIKEAMKESDDEKSEQSFKYRRVVSKLNVLRNHVKNQKRKIKILNQSVRRCKKKISKNKDLTNKNKKVTVCDQLHETIYTINLL